MPSTFTAPPSSGNPVLLPTGHFTEWWYGWFSTGLIAKLNKLFNTTYSGTVPLTKLTVGGVAGSITFVNGIATAVTPPT